MIPPEDDRTEFFSMSPDPAGGNLQCRDCKMRQKRTAMAGSDGMPGTNIRNDVVIAWVCPYIPALVIFVSSKLFLAPSIQLVYSVISPLYSVLYLPVHTPISTYSRHNAGQDAPGLPL